MSAAWPRMMRARTAKRYLDGLDPLLEYGVAPEIHKGEPFYDRAAIDRAIDAKAGLTPPPRSDDPDAALQAWRESHGPS